MNFISLTFLTRFIAEVPIQTVAPSPVRPCRHSHFVGSNHLCYTVSWSQREFCRLLLKLFNRYCKLCHANVYYVIIYA